MNIKIVFSDIDGTFLTNDHRVTRQTAEAVNRLLNKNIPFVLVSARMPEAIYPITDTLGIKIPIISYSGGLVLTEAEEVLYSKTIDPNSARLIIAAIDRDFPQVTINYYAGRRWFVRDTSDPRVKVEEDITSAASEAAEFDRLLRAEVLPNKILVMSDPPDCERMERELGRQFRQLNIVRSHPTLLEIMDRSVSKATGIEVMLKHFGISPDEAIGFGDNYNDIEMFEYVGHGVAMANAPEPIKKLVDEITESNENSGIYTYLVKTGII